jgi:hypothetical protein
VTFDPDRIPAIRPRCPSCSFAGIVPFCAAPCCARGAAGEYAVVVFGWEQQRWERRIQKWVFGELVWTWIRDWTYVPPPRHRVYLDWI